MQIKPEKYKKSRLQSVKVLLDSGFSGCLVNEALVKKLTCSNKPPSHWTTKSGTFTTNKSCQVALSFPERHQDKHITWPMHVDTGQQLPNRYDIILGRDAMVAIGMDLIFSKQEIQWQDTTIPMKTTANSKNKTTEELENEAFQLDEVKKTSFNALQRSSILLLIYKK